MKQSNASDYEDGLKFQDGNAIATLAS